MPGLPGVHQSRWSVKIVAPMASEDRAWYDEFVRRWQEYLASLASGTEAPRLFPSRPLLLYPLEQLPPPSARPALARPPSGKASRHRPAPPPPGGLGPSKRCKVPQQQPSPLVDILVNVDRPASPPPRVPPSPPRVRSPAAPSSPRPPKHQRSLLHWLRPSGAPAAPPATVLPDPAAASSSTAVFHRSAGARAGHGRATQAPPT